MIIQKKETFPDDTYVHPWDNTTAPWYYAFTTTMCEYFNISIIEISADHDPDMFKNNRIDNSCFFRAVSVQLYGNANMTTDQRIENILMIKNVIGRFILDNVDWLFANRSIFHIIAGNIFFEKEVQKTIPAKIYNDKEEIRKIGHETLNGSDSAETS